MIFTLVILLIPQFESLDLAECFYDYLDEQLNLENQIPLSYSLYFDSDQNSNDSIGFGIWSKYIPNLLYYDYEYPQRPFDNITCFYKPCHFEGFLFLKIYDLDNNNIAAIILRMKDNPVSVSHDIYTFEINDEKNVQQGQFKFQSNNYHNNWIYSSIIYQYTQQQLIFFTNFQNQKISFHYNIKTQGIHIIFGGFKDNLSLNFIKDWKQLLFFKGKFSNFLNYGSFNYFETLLEESLQYCPFKIQKSNILFQDLTKSVSQFSDNLFQYQLIQKNQILLGKRYSIQGWIKQRYDKALEDYMRLLNQQPTILRQYVFFGSANNLLQNQFNGDEALQFYYLVDYEQNNRTQIIFQTYFIKIPILNKLYNHMENFYKFTYEDDNLKQKTQQWHYFVFDYGRQMENDQSYQVRIYFINEYPIIKNLGTSNFNVQFHGPLLFLCIISTPFQSIYTSTQLQGLIVTTGQTEDNNDQFICHQSCQDCNGPFYNNCTLCSSEKQIYLTKINTCECLFEYQFDEKLQKCIPLEQTQFLTIIEQKIQYNCDYGYFQFQNQQNNLCIKCPSFHSNQLLCADCLEQSENWYLKLTCTYDYLQDSENFVFIKKQRKNQDIDLYYINENFEIDLEKGAIFLCELNQIDCYKSQHFHLGQQMRIKCKINYYYHGFQCKPCSEYCLNCDNNGNCIKCEDQFYLDQQTNSCKKCPNECLQCETDFSSYYGYKCISCQHHYSILQGQCQPCGINCDYCQQDYNQENQRYFLRCLSCLDHNKMVIRINAIDCKIVDIQQCLYPIMFSELNFINNSFNQKFQPSNDISIERIGCSLCENGYAIKSQYDLCYELDKTILDQCITGMDFHLIENGIDYGEFLVCIIGNEEMFPLLSIGENCYKKNQNCQFCLNIMNSELGSCLKCISGYYAHRLTGQCLKCNENLNCYTCYHSSRGYYDEWKIWQTSLIQTIILNNIDRNFDFRYSMQSQNIDDYEIVCTSCYSGYVLFNNSCIKYCENDCQKCLLIDGQYICQQCKLNNNIQIQSLIEGKCTQCQNYCRFCRQRNQSEIQSINPIFDSMITQNVQYQCLIPNLESNEYLLYDTKLGQFQKCENQNTSFQKTLIISLNLYCDEQIFLKDLNTNETPQQKQQFRQNNIFFGSFITQNIGDDSFSDFNLQEIYTILKQKEVRSISIEIESKTSQVCSSFPLGYIQQQFSSDIFNIIDVQLYLKAQKQSQLILEITKELNFINFSKVHFQNILFSLQQNNYQKILSIKSLIPVDIIIENTIIESKNYQYQTIFSFNLIIQGNQQLEALNFKISIYKIIKQMD